MKLRQHSGERVANRNAKIGALRGLEKVIDLIGRKRENKIRFRSE